MEVNLIQIRSAGRGKVDRREGCIVIVLEAGESVCAALRHRAASVHTI